MNKRKKMYLIAIVLVIASCLWAFISAAFITKNFKTDVINNLTEKQELKVKGVFATETKGGIKYWELYGDEGQVDSESRIAILYNPIGNFYNNGEVILSFKANKGTYQEEGRKVILYDDTLIVYKDGTHVTANKFIWAGQDNIIMAKGNVVISRADGQFIIKGQEAILDHDMTHFTIKNKSESRIYQTDGVKIK